MARKKLSKKAKGKLKQEVVEEAKAEERNREGYELIITEKPQACAKIAFALGNGNAIKRSDAGIPYYEVNREGRKIVVGCAIGHLFTLASKQNGLPIFDLEWQPNYKVRKQDFTKKYYQTITKLAKEANSFIIATDYDIEGELIGWNILKFICQQKDAKRMKFSTLTKLELEKAYDNPQKHIDFGLARAGETRHILDYIYGINLSRAIMTAIRKAGKYQIMSIGRVQGPALAFVVEREKEIQNFKAKPYWQVFLQVRNSHQVEVKYEKDIKKKIDLAKFQKLKGKEAEAKTEKKERSLQAPHPFDLTTLQIEAYRLFGITPSQLLRIAQQLYLAGLISYPRTSSQKLPTSIGYRNIFQKLEKFFSELVKYAKKQKPIEGRKSDVHPAIYPTGEFGKLAGDNSKIYDLIVRRFIACFCSEAIIEDKKIEVKIDNLKFLAKGLNIKEKGWLNVYKAAIFEKRLPDLEGKVKIREIRIEEKMTQPPRRYTQASLVSELTRRNLGTKATRAMVIDTLFNRGYIKGKVIEATPFGINLIDTLKKESPIIIDEKLTRKFEKEMENIEKEKESEVKVIREAKNLISQILEEFKKKEEKIGKELLIGYKEAQEQKKEEGKIMLCLQCKKGHLVIRRSKIGKQFLACDAYPNCTNTYSIPQNALIKKIEKEKCEACGFPLLISYKKGKRPWKFCFNPACPKRNQIQKYEKARKKD